MKARGRMTSPRADPRANRCKMWPAVPARARRATADACCPPRRWCSCSYPTKSVAGKFAFDRRTKASAGEISVSSCRQARPSWPRRAPRESRAQELADRWPGLRALDAALTIVIAIASRLRPMRRRIASSMSVFISIRRPTTALPQRRRGRHGRCPFDQAT